jgi:hypothetical protein
MKYLKKNWLILLILPFAIYFSVNTITKRNIENYYYNFNDERLKIGLKPIDSTWNEPLGQLDEFHSWVNKETNIPRYYTKYIMCDNWMHTITKEYDSYLVKIDTTTYIVSILYDFNKKEFSYALEEYNNPQKGRFGKLVKEMKKEEATDVLKSNGIVY